MRPRKLVAIIRPQKSGPAFATCTEAGCGVSIAHQPYWLVRRGSKVEHICTVCLPTMPKLSRAS